MAAVALLLKTYFLSVHLTLNTDLEKTHTYTHTLMSSKRAAAAVNPLNPALFHT